MTPYEILTAYLNLLYKSFYFDYWVFSQWWCYVFFLIPAICYFIFFLFKWLVLLTPILTPIYGITSIIANLRGYFKLKSQNK